MYLWEKCPTLWQFWHFNLDAGQLNPLTCFISPHLPHRFWPKILFSFFLQSGLLYQLFNLCIHPWISYYDYPLYWLSLYGHFFWVIDPDLVNCFLGVYPFFPFLGFEVFTHLWQQLLTSVLEKPIIFCVVALELYSWLAISFAFWRFICSWMHHFTTSQLLSVS